MLVAAILMISGALVFYSIGVWGEKIKGRLSPLWLLFYWTGLVCDIAGTALMGNLAEDPFRLSFHGVTGMLAIILMAANALWATIVLLRKDEKAIKGFHRYSIAVWLVWLVPYLSGALFGVNMGG